LISSAVEFEVLLVFIHARKTPVNMSARGISLLVIDRVDEYDRRLDDTHISVPPIKIALVDKISTGFVILRGSAVNEKGKLI
jgi:hypothetical protein